MFIFVHGYGTNINSSISKYRKRKNSGVSSAIINLEPCSVFDWSEQLEVPKQKTLSLPYYLKHYYLERQKSHQLNVHQAFYQFLLENQPKVIICHSLGCELFLNYLRNFTVPSSVKEVVFLHADVSVKAIRQHKQLHHLLLSNQIKLTNYYCPWDYVLGISTLLHRKLRLGLRKLSMPNVENRLSYSKAVRRPHTSCLSNRRVISQLLEN